MCTLLLQTVFGLNISKKNFFHIIFLLVKAKLSIIFTTATNWIGWIVVPDFIQPIATWETFHFMHACIKMLILFKPGSGRLTELSHVYLLCIMPTNSESNKNTIVSKHLT